MSDDVTTKNEPIKVLNVGISSQIIKPKKIANNKPKYFNGVTSETSENL